ncbi:MAG: N-formylglutamate amidohydrolase [Nitratireductor sp.]|nr:N-formylglutamate amidohydrolase [Nitratireductor sp.]
MADVAADGQAEESVVSTYNPTGASPVLIVCEHASNHIPESFHDLGLTDDVAVSHVAWDPGAGQVAKYLADLVDAPCLLSGVSRLVYDCNRPPDAPDAIPAKSEIHRIPGNEGLGSAERARRVAGYYMPFKRALENEVSKLPVDGALVTVHSFTPVYFGKPREVELGILHDADSRLADAMLAVLPGFCDLNVQRNEPYGPQDGVTHTLKQHGLANGLLNVMIEIRNDLLRSNEQCSAISQLLAEALQAAIGQCAPAKTVRGIA